MTDLDDVRRKRLRFRSWHRGTREMDLLLGSFAERHLAELSAQQLTDYEALLEVGDPDLYSWIAGDAPVPSPYDTAILQLIKDFKLHHLRT
jgi:antitoxin CptB